MSSLSLIPFLHFECYPQHCSFEANLAYMLLCADTKATVVRRRLTAQCRNIANMEKPSNILCLYTLESCNGGQYCDLYMSHPCSLLVHVSHDMLTKHHIFYPSCFRSLEVGRPTERYYWYSKKHLTLCLNEFLVPNPNNECQHGMLCIFNERVVHAHNQFLFVPYRGIGNST